MRKNSDVDEFRVCFVQFHPAFAQFQEMAKSPGAEALMTGLVSAAAGAGAHPAVAAAAQSAYAQGAKDAVLQIHNDIQAATSAPLAGLSRQSSLALTRANSMLQSAGPSLSPHDAFDALSHQAGQVLQHSGELAIHQYLRFHILDCNAHLDSHSSDVDFFSDFRPSCLANLALTWI